MNTPGKTATAGEAALRETVMHAVIVALDTVVDDLPEVTEETRLFDSLGLDSTMVLDLIMRLEDELGLVVDVDSLAMSDFETVGTLTDFALSQAVE